MIDSSGKIRIIIVMQHTDLLEIIVEQGFNEMEMAIHPNDGEDLDLYTLEHSLIFYSGNSLEKFKSGEGQLGEGRLRLLNECPLGTLSVSNYLIGRLQYCEKAILIRDKNKLFVTYRE